MKNIIFKLLLCLITSLYQSLSYQLPLTMSINNHNLPKTSKMQSSIEITRNTNILLKTLQVLTLTSTIALNSNKVNAKTYFDTDVYGDKELKIATVNKLKQKLRNAILQDITIAPILLKLSINDALGYNAEDQEGGPDGSIQYEIDRPENKGLEKGIEIINNIKKEMQRTNVISFADVTAFAGSEALEAIGSGRIVVQVGRFDATKANVKSTIVPWNDLSKDSVNLAFEKSGLGAKEITVLFGALGEINRVVSETISAKKAAIDEEDEDDEGLDEEPFVPVTFGKRDDIYGAKVGKGDIGSKYFSSLLKTNAANDEIGKILLDDPKTKEYVKKYSTNEVAFIKDLTDTYLKLTLLGESYTTRNS